MGVGTEQFFIFEASGWRGVGAMVLDSGDLGEGNMVLFEMSYPCHHMTARVTHTNTHTLQRILRDIFLKLQCVYEFTQSYLISFRGC